MSSNEITLLTNFVGKDVGTTAAINEIGGAATNTGRKLSQMGGQGAAAAGLMATEWARFKRTFSYATSGLATYEIFNAISRIRDYQVNLAQLNSTLQTTPDELNKFGQAAIDISNRTATPLNDVFQSMQNIATSIPGLGRAARDHLIPVMANIEAMGARISGTDPASFGSTVLALATAFGGRQRLAGPGAENFLRGIASQVVEIQKRIPNPQGGQQYLQSLSMLTQGAVTAGFTLPQALSLYAVAQRTLVRPTTTGQYLRQLFIRLGSPTRAEQPFFQQAGLDRTRLAGMSGMEILRTLIEHGLSLPGGLTPQGGASQQEVQQFMRTGNFRRLNVTGQAADYFRQSIGGRIQSLVAIRGILAGLQQLPLEQQALARARQTDEVQKRFNDTISQMPMEQARNAIENMTTDIGVVFSPALNTVSRSLYGMSRIVEFTANDLGKMRSFINRHTGNVPVLGGRLGGMAEIATVAAAGLGARAIIRSGRIGSLINRVPGLRRLGIRGAQDIIDAPLAGVALQGEAMSVTNALAGRAMGTPDAPFWVVIHPLSRSQVPELFQHFAGAGGGGGGGAGGAITTGAEGAGAATLLTRARSIISRFGSVGRSGIGRRFGAAGALALLEESPAIPDIISSLTGGDPFRRPSDPTPLLNYYAGRDNLTARQRSIVMAQYHHHITQARAEAMLGGTGLSEAFLRQVEPHGVPRGLQPYFARFQSGQINQRQLNRAVANYAQNTARAVAQHPGHETALQQAILGMFRLGPGHQLRLSAQRRDLAHGYVEATLQLEPTQEFRNLLRPQQVKVHIPITASPAPRSRGRTRTARSR